jgi:hypothetical protein
MILYNAKNNVELSNLKKYLETIGLLLIFFQVSLTPNFHLGMQNDHVFVNSDKRPKFDWNMETKVADRKQVGRKIGECVTLWRGSLYSTSCEQPASFACENKPSIVANKYALHLSQPIITRHNFIIIFIKNFRSTIFSPLKKPQLKGNI